MGPLLRACISALEGVIRLHRIHLADDGDRPAASVRRPPGPRPSS